MDITLIGGHGKIALLAEPLLSQAGHTVRAVIRNPDHSADVEATGAIPVVADIQSLDDPGWEELLSGSDLVIWSAGAGGGSPERTYAVDRDAAKASMDAASRLGVGRYLMVSYFGAGPDHGVPEDDGFFAYAESKAAADAHLRASDLSWTILAPSALTAEPAGGRIDTQAASSASVSREDVARVIAAAVERPQLVGRFLAFNAGDTPIDVALDAPV